MSFFKNFDWSFKSVVKIVGLALLGIVVITIVIALFSFALKTVFETADYDYDGGYYDRKIAQEESYPGAPPTTGSALISEKDVSKAGLPQPKGDDEQYEIKTHNATIRTRRLEKTCTTVSELKNRPEVIFETSSIDDKSCTFNFKVKKEKEAEIIVIIQGLKPENFGINIQTVKKTVESYDQELDILKNKLTSIEDTLTKAQNAYDVVSDLATRKQDVESLATIIENKLSLIDELTTQRLEVKEEIDRYMQSKADILERLQFSFFNVTVYEDLIFDWKQIKDSWKYELRRLVDHFNEVIQGISVHLLTYLIRFAQVALYFFISLFLLKGVWVVTKRVWKGKAQPAMGNMPIQK